MKNFKPCANQVLIRWIPTVKNTDPNMTDAGIVLLDGAKTTNLGGKNVEVDEYLFQVIDVGENVDLEKVSFKIGDLVIFNEMDMKILGDNDEKIFCLTRDVSIMATYETNAYPQPGWDLKKY